MGAQPGPASAKRAKTRQKRESKRRPVSKCRPRPLQGACARSPRAGGGAARACCRWSSRRKEHQCRSSMTRLAASSKSPRVNPSRAETCVVCNEWSRGRVSAEQKIPKMLKMAKTGCGGQAAVRPKSLKRSIGPEGAAWPKCPKKERPRSGRSRQNASWAGAKRQRLKAPKFRTTLQP